MVISMVIFVLLALMSEQYICTVVNTTCELSGNNVWTCDRIPFDIPKNVTRVHIKKFLAEESTFEINDTFFKADNWRHVEDLQFSDNNLQDGNDTVTHVLVKDHAFRNLPNLRSLQLNTYHKRTDLETDSLSDLNNVKVLDFSDCFRLHMGSVCEALNGTDKVPNLEQLKLSGLNVIWTPLTIDRKISACLAHKPIAHLDLSRTRISVLKFDILKDLTKLRKLNISHSSINDIDLKDMMPSYFRHINTIDLSNVTGGFFKIITNSYSNLNYKFSNSTKNNIFFAIKTFNLSGIITVPITLNHIVIRSDTYFKSYSKELILMENSLRRFDVRFICHNFDFRSIEVLNLAKNGLEYLHQSIFECLINIVHLDLSENNLHHMCTENRTLVEQVLQPLKNLKNIQLASNDFINLPKDIFDKNVNIEEINIEDNKLTQIHFKVDNLSKLRILKLSKNRIKILDEVSMNNLDLLSRPTHIHNILTINDTDTDSDMGLETKVDIQFNPFLCNKCDTLSFVRWVVTNKYLFDGLSVNMKCTDESGKERHMNGDTAVKVQDICYRKTRNIIVISTVSVATGLIISLSIFVCKKMRQRQKQARRTDLIDMLNMDASRFFVFLSYSSDDEDFVLNNILDPLNDGLQRIIGTDRTLVCIGDHEFRPGRYELNESMICIEKSVVFLIVVSESYCSSDLCETELNQALQLNRPVMLMIKENVNEDMMTPTMQLLFRNKTRILWENNNGVYRLKTSWENVCESILNSALD